MTTKLDYLKDLREHPHSTGGEAAARLEVPEANVLQAYRRARTQGLVEGDSGRPEKFVLNEAGLTQLRVLEGQGTPKPSAFPPNIEAKITELEEALGDVAQDVKGLFGIVDRLLSTKPTDDVAEDLLAEKQELEEQLANSARIMELYAVQTASALTDGGEESFKERGEKLERELDSKTVQSVRRLVELEERLRAEQSRLWGPKLDRVRAFEEEIAQLREELGFAVEEEAEAE